MYSTESLSRAGPSRDACWQLYDMSRAEEPSWAVSCAQVELLDTGTAAELLTPLLLGQHPLCKKMVLRWDHHPIHRWIKSSWICSCSFMQMVWDVLLTLRKKMSWGAGPKASEPWHVSRP